MDVHKGFSEQETVMSSTDIHSMTQTVTLNAIPIHTKTKIKFDIYGSPHTESQGLILSLYKWQALPGLSLHGWSCWSENPNPSPQRGNWWNTDKGKNGEKRVVIKVDSPEKIEN